MFRDRHHPTPRGIVRSVEEQNGRIAPAEANLLRVQQSRLDIGDTISEVRVLQTMVAQYLWVPRTVNPSGVSTANNSAPAFIDL